MLYLLFQFASQSVSAQKIEFTLIGGGGNNVEEYVLSLLQGRETLFSSVVVVGVGRLYKAYDYIKRVDALFTLSLRGSCVTLKANMVWLGSTFRKVSTLTT